MVKRHEKCSILFVIRKMQMETTIVRTTIIINQQTTNVGADVEKREPSCTVDGTANCCRHCGEQYGVSSKKKKIKKEKK